MTMPTAEASIAFATDPLAAPSWTVIQQPRAFSTKRLRSPQLGRFESGTFDGVFGNTNRSLEPLYASGANYPNVRVRKRLRLRATHNSVTYPVYDGFIESIKPTYPAKGIDAIASLTASDAFRIFAGVPLQAPYVAEVLADAPDAYYRLSEVSGAATAADASGHGRNAAYPASGVTYQAASLITDTSDKSVVLTNVAIQTPVPPVVGSAAAFTWVLAVQRPVAGWTGGQTNVMTQIANDRASVAIIVSDTWVRLLLIAADGTTSTLQLLTTLLTDNLAHVIQVSRDGAGNTFVGCDLAGTSGSDTTVVPTGTVYIGDPRYSAVFGVDEVATYSAAVSGARLAAQNAASTGRANELPGVRLGWLLDKIGWPSADRDVPLYGVEFLGAGDDLSSKKALDHLRDIDATEGGALFMSRDGKVTFRERYAIEGVTAASSTSQMTFGDGGGAEVPYTDLVIAFDDKEFANQVTVSRHGGITTIATDSASITKYGVQGLSRNSVAYSDVGVTGQAQWLLTLLKDPNKLRFETITVSLDSPLTNAAIAAVLGREIWDRVTVAFQPPGGGARISQDVIVTGISHKVSPSRWDVSFQVSGTELGYQMFILNDASLGVLTTGAGRLGY